MYQTDQTSQLGPSVSNLPCSLLQLQGGSSAVSVLITDSMSRFYSPSPLLQLCSPPYGPDAEAQLEPLEGPGLVICSQQLNGSSNIPGGQASPEGSARWTAPLGAEHCTEQQARWGCVQGWTSPGEALCSRLRPSAPSLGQLVLHMWIFSK